jgi:tetratricopeptide (TPR) repeat protein
VDDVLARGLAKDPQHRFTSGSELVAALRDALDRAAGTTRVAALQPVPRRRRVPMLLIGLGAALLAGVLAAALLAGRDDDRETQETTAPQTVRETVTLPGTTVVETVTTAAEKEPEPTTSVEEDDEPTPPAGAAELNDQGFQLMQEGRYEEALPLLEQAVAGLSGSGDIAEAYASYNLAFTRRALGRCDGVLELLDRSEQVQGERKEITRLRKETEKAC